MPDDNINSPPDPLFPDPTVTYIDPPRPELDVPDPMYIEPLLPELDVPVLITTNPLIPPEVPALDDRINKSPLEVLELYPPNK